MADDQGASNDVGDGEELPEAYDAEDITEASASASPSVIQDSTNPPPADYDDEPIADYVVKLVVDEQGDGAILDAAVTDINGNVISSNTRINDIINSYTTSLYDELNGNATAIASSKRWWGWSTKKLIFAALIALCILGIILAIVFFLLGKKFKKNKRPTAAGTTTTTKAVVTKGVSPDQKYQPVPNV